MNSLLITGQTDVGQRRKDNQDTFICSMIWAESGALLAVIDGVGGYAGGEQAAAIAKESIEQYMTTPNGDPLSMLREAVVFANNQINKQRQQDHQLAHMCCVLTAAVVDHRSGKLYFVHVGDTRLYRYRQGMLEKLTHDHSLVGVREDANELTEAEAMHHPRRNEILREVGLTAHRVDDPDFLESGETDFLPGDQLLLCSDGLTDMITQAQIRAVLDQMITLEQQTAELIRVANEQGGNDNITVVLAKNNLPLDERSAGSAKADRTSVPKQAPLVTSPIAPVTSSEKNQPVNQSRVGLWTTLGFLLGALVAGIVWYQFQPSRQSSTLVVAESHTSDNQENVLLVDEKAARLDSMVQVAYRSKDHRLILPADTFHLDKPLVLTDSLQSIVGGNRLTVLMPTDTSRVPVALRITRAGAVRVENIVISGFRTGIETTRDAKLQLANVSFRNVGLPISAVVRQDTFRNAVVMVSVQNQPDSTKTLRP
ncbi:PP2C family protein-serine/threonine phosphatase [Spirosoma validum]|uniref:Serine/threonine-protein phosphatase n=1 Tax=Spirosoma validum TaxID=2771355 RepID=A0A927GFH2_9BACT|nr:protein phosphatase 2C domain-containing protein [Spirosoma validum]MBD2755829.1 serine/threonine-protein phosphatase [Spirosoma validum]